jgi:hypothetical protein
MLGTDAQQNLEEDFSLKLEVNMRHVSSASVTLLTIACFLFWLLLSITTAVPPVPRSPDFPLASNTRWTYHLHQEVGEGVHFGEEDAKLAKGNSLDVSVISQVVGTEFFGALKYTRIESRLNGRIWLTEWERLGPEGLMLGKTIDPDEGQATVMNPPQKMLSPTLKTGESWDWKPSRLPLSMHVSVVGPDKVTVPAGTFDAVQVLHVMTTNSPAGSVIVRQTRWFVAGVGYVKQDTESRLGSHMLSHVVLTLEKYEPGTKP